jgi:hypothetical protein
VGHHRTAFHTTHELSEYYVGKDPTRVEHHFWVVSGKSHSMGAVLGAAMSAMDIIMWDILGNRSAARCTSCWEEHAAMGSVSSPASLATRWSSARRECDCSHAKGLHLSQDDSRLAGL